MKGEIGVALPNDMPEKYAVLLDFGDVKLDPSDSFLGGPPLESYRRILYFYAEDVELEADDSIPIGGFKEAQQKTIAAFEAAVLAGNAAEVTRLGGCIQTWFRMPDPPHATGKVWLAARAEELLR